MIVSKKSFAETTKMINDLSRGETPAELLPLVYDELRRLAQGYLNNERAGHTLPATALVHEAYIRLVGWENVTWQNRQHFFAVAAQIMRRVLVDYARARSFAKRDGEQHKIQLSEILNLPEQSGAVDLLMLDDALDALAKFDLQQSKIVELRFFGGLTIEETAAALSISPATVKREWTIAKAWLFREIGVNNAAQ